MIKISRKQECQSYWRENALYDKERKTSHTIKLFGLTIWHDEEDYKSNLSELTSENGKKLGFRQL